MKLLRNPEVIKTVLLHGVISAVAVFIAFMWEGRFGVFTLVLSVLLLLVHMVSTSMRYKRLSDLSADIDRILHEEDGNLSLEQYSEGELSILQSEIHKMTNRLKEQKQRLLEDKVYLADSIADISHQIRTPLTSINLLVQLLSEPILSAERRIKLTHELLELFSRIDWLIAALLKISKLDAGTVQFKKERIAISDLIRKATTPLLVPMELRGQLLTVKAEGEFTGDVSWTQEAIGNIVKNCMEHTPESGEITINAAENALYTEIVISDNGSGIDKQDLPHIFERFYKGKNSDEKSFGIGLALSRMIVTVQNGTIKAENNPSQGAKFTIRFYKGVV